MRRAVEDARGRWLLLADRGVALTEADVERLLESSRSRDVDGVTAVAPSPGVLTKCAAAVVRRLLGIRARDPFPGVLLLDRVRVRPVFARTRMDEVAADVELVYLAEKLGLEIVPSGVETAGATPPRSPWALGRAALRIRAAMRAGDYRAAATEAD